MEDMLQIEKQITALSELLQEHKGQDVCALDLRGINNWTDFFIIATVSSRTHMDGLRRHIKDYCRQNEIEILGNRGFKKKQGINTDDEWHLIDLGFAVVHLMTKNAREFYELERLWKSHNT